MSFAKSEGWEQKPFRAMMLGRDSGLDVKEVEVLWVLDVRTWFGKGGECLPHGWAQVIARDIFADPWHAMEAPTYECFVRALDPPQPKFHFRQLVAITYPMDGHNRYATIEKIDLDERTKPSHRLYRVVENGVAMNFPEDQLRALTEEEIHGKGESS